MPGARRYRPRSMSPSAAVAPPASSFEPVAETPRYPPPAASVSPDKSKTWLRRLGPVVVAHPGVLAFSVGASIVSMLTSVAAPAVLGFAINDALAEQPDPDSIVRGTLEPLLGALGLDAAPDGRLSLTAYVVLLLVLGVVRAAATGLYRYGLYRTAYHIETDLRSLIYEQLTRLPVLLLRPHAVRPGHLAREQRHPLDPDAARVRAAGAACRGSASCWRSSFMLSHPRRADARGGVRDARRVPGRHPHAQRDMFPLSWMVQARIRRRRDDRRREHPGRARGEVVRRRGAPDQRARRAAQRAAVGVDRARRHTRARSRRSWRTSRGSARPSCCCTAASS